MCAQYITELKDRNANFIQCFLFGPCSNQPFLTAPTLFTGSLNPSFFDAVDSWLC